MQRTGTQPAILVVEDYADSRQMLKLLLESMAYRVLTGGAGNDALTIAKTNFDTLKEIIERLLRYSHTQPQTLQIRY